METFSPLLSTERLILRYFENRDSKILFEYRNDPILSKFQGWPIPYTQDILEDFFVSMSKRTVNTKNVWVQIAIEDKERGVLIGDIGYHNDGEKVELGITLRAEFQSQGYATEALSDFIRYLVRELKIHRFVAIIDAENSSSIALFERLGFRQEGFHLKSFWNKIIGDWRDEYLYAMLDSEVKGNCSSSQ